MGGEAFVLKWAAVPADIVAHHHWITILTAMFMHGSWSHIIGNMIFLWAFGPEIEDAMNPVRYASFYLAGGVVAMLAQVAVTPHSTVPSLGASGAIAAVMGAFMVTYPTDEIRSLLVIFIFVRVTFIPAAILIGIWFLLQLLNVGEVATVQTGGWRTWHTLAASSLGYSLRDCLRAVSFWLNNDGRDKSEQVQISAPSYPEDNGARHHAAFRTSCPRCGRCSALPIANASGLAHLLPSEYRTEQRANRFHQ
jgi:hypothetical protein